MTTKRIPIARARHPRLTPEMRPKAERLVELNAAHHKAIQGSDTRFYTDGRHDEMLQIGPEVRQALGIRPWDDDDQILRAALKE